MACQCSTMQQSNIQPNFSFYFSILILIQTIITLNLHYNQIGLRGAQHLANVLRQNKVIYLTESRILFLTHHLTQTITTLNLHYNQIGPQGAEHLGNALHQNKVKYSKKIPRSLFHHRPSPYWTSDPMKSDHKEQNILPMLYNKTK